MTKEKKISLLAGLITFGIIILFIFLAYRFITGGFMKSAPEQSTNLLMDNYFDEEKYHEALNDTPSDIDGYTQLQKYQYGLSPEDGSDTDMDGLTDKEEIEIYGSDPLLYSTSGDMYSDAYKVENRMDLGKYYEYNDDLDLQNNVCPEVMITPSTAQEYEANIIDYTGESMFKLDGVEVLKEYFVALYSGKIAINLTNAGIADVNADDLVVYGQSFYEESAKKINHTLNGVILTIDPGFKADTPYIIYIAKKGDNVIENAVPILSSGKTTSHGTLKQDVLTVNTKITDVYSAPEVLCYGSLLIRGEMSIIYDDSVVGSEIAAREMVKECNELKKSGSPFGNSNVSFEDYKAISKKSSDEIAKQKSFFEKFLSAFRMKWEWIDDNNEYGGYFSLGIKDSIFTWFTYEDYLKAIAGHPRAAAAYESSGEISVPSSIHLANGFSYDDILPFQNFSTNIANGVCAGFSHLTAELFNTGSLSYSAGSYQEAQPAGFYLTSDASRDGKIHDFNITMDVENTTLLDRGLSDFKSPEFVNTHMDANGKLQAGLTEGEQNFVDMMTYGWILGNNINRDGHYKVHNTSDIYDNKTEQVKAHFEGRQVIDEITKEIDAGHIVDAHFIVKDKKTGQESGHAVNIIGYENRAADYVLSDTSRIFYVYDCNRPYALGTLTTQIVYTSSGMSILFYHLNIPGLEYSADSTGQDMSMFIAMDHEFNLLNDR